MTPHLSVLGADPIASLLKTARAVTRTYASESHTLSIGSEVEIVAVLNQGSGRAS
jgi:hypothetical protein